MSEPSQPFPLPPGPPSGPSELAPAIDQLRRTKPWVRFMAILGFCMAALIVLVGLSMLFMGSLMEGVGPLGGIAMGTFYLLMSLVYVFPCLALNRYASAIQGLIAAGPDAAGPAGLTVALDEQRRFWRMIGLISIAMVCLYALVLAIAVAVGIAAALLGAARS